MKTEWTQRGSAATAKTQRSEEAKNTQKRQIIVSSSLRLSAFASLRFAACAARPSKEVV
jgi:hypothetical protein